MDTTWVGDQYMLDFAHTLRCIQSPVLCRLCEGPWKKSSYTCKKYCMHFRSLKSTRVGPRWSWVDCGNTRIPHHALHLWQQWSNPWPLVNSGRRKGLHVQAGNHSKSTPPPSRPLLPTPLHNTPSGTACLPAPPSPSTHKVSYSSKCWSWILFGRRSSTVADEMVDAAEMRTTLFVPHYSFVRHELTTLLDIIILYVFNFL